MFQLIYSSAFIRWEGKKNCAKNFFLIDYTLDQGLSIGQPKYINFIKNINEEVRSVVRIISYMLMTLQRYLLYMIRNQLLVFLLFFFKFFSWINYNQIVLLSSGMIKYFHYLIHFHISLVFNTFWISSSALGLKQLRCFSVAYRKYYIFIWRLKRTFFFSLKG